MKYPSISVIIFARNEKQNLLRLFPSLKKQKYPKSKIEYIFVDDKSTDSTPELAKKFGAKVINVNTSDIELNKGIGMHAAKNDLIFWMDADMELCSNNFWNLLVKPLVENTNIIGSFTNEFSLKCKKPVKNSLLRFISHDPLQRDPLYQFFSPSIDSKIIKSTNNYHICKFEPGSIPPCGRTLYRRKELLKTDVAKNKSFIDLETLEILVRAGHNKFAYVPKAKIRHYHATSLKQLITKRLRNLERDYLPLYETKYYRWFDLSKPKDKLKIVFWVIYANLFIPELIRGLYLAITKKDLAFLWQPVVAISTTDAIIWGFISKPKGRKIMLKLLKNNDHSSSPRS